MLNFFLAVFALTVVGDDNTQHDETASSAPVLQLEVQDENTQNNSDAILNSAGEYAEYHRVISDLRDAPIGSGDDLDEAMDRLSVFYGEDRLARAWIAYAAMIASQHPEYLDDVQEVADYYGPEAAMSGLMYDPAFATSFTHSVEAQSSVVDAIEVDSAEIRSVSERYRAAAYDLQSERWARTRSANRQDRLSSLANSDDRAITVDQDVLVSLGSGDQTHGPASSLFASPTSSAPNSAASPNLSLTVGEATYAPDRTRIGRILSVAALQSLSDNPDEISPALEALLADPAVERCLAWVRLDMQQCVAAGHFKYEDSFCIAEHALLDVSRCLGASPASGSH